MNLRSRLAMSGLLVAGTVLASSSPAWAHGLGGSSDLPLPLWLFAYGAAAALVISFVALGVFWPQARFEGGPAGVALVAPRNGLAVGLAAAGRAIGLGLFAVVFAAAAFGSRETAENLAPVFVYVVFWVGMILVSSLVGDVWRVLNPFDTLAALIQRVRRSRSPDAAGRRPYGLGYWPAVAGLFGFVWLELVYPDRAQPRVLAVAIAVYTALVLAAASRWGRGWLRQGEAFTALFGVLAHMAPVYGDDEGRLRLRPPLAGLASLERAPGLEGLVLVGLGSTTFDGISRTRLWADMTENLGKWPLTALNTLGLVWAIGLVALAYVAAMRVTARLQDGDSEQLAAAFVHSLVPIALAYAVAHYFSLLVFEGQGALALASDPFGRGWDLFGTADRPIDYRAVSTTTIAYVQVGAIVVGHIAGVVVAHDRALALFPGRAATRSQYPLLAAMVLFTVGGLTLLLGA